VFNGDLSQLAALAGSVGATPTGALGDVNGDGRVDVLARDGATGVLWLYPNAGGNTFGARSQVGTGWSGMSAIEVADVNGDGRVDVLARDGATGVLWLYPNTGRTGMDMFGGARVQVGTGWDGMSAINAADVNGDGKPDVLARDGATGVLWLYPNTGRTGMDTFGGARVQVGTGWGGMSAINAADVNGDGRVDIVSRDGATGVFWLYPNTGRTGMDTFGGPRIQIGTGWNGMTDID
jgi:FG-GAP-like repeat/EF hand